MQTKPQSNPAGAAPPSHRKEVVAWALVAIWALVIFALSAKSGLELDSGSGVLSLVKSCLAQMLRAIAGHEVDPSPIGHFGEYLVFGFLLVNALKHRLDKGKAARIALAACALYAASDELHQAFVPGRACDPLDWVVDVSAAAVAVAAWWALARKGSPRA